VNRAGAGLASHDAALVVTGFCLSVARGFLPVPQVETHRHHDAWQPHEIGFGLEGKLIAEENHHRHPTASL
jgi:hypothetical protein